MQAIRNSGARVPRPTNHLQIRQSFAIISQRTIYFNSILNLHPGPFKGKRGGHWFALSRQYTSLLFLFMRLLVLLAAALLLTLCARSASPTSQATESNPVFRQQQQQYPRVRAAYALHETELHALLRRNGISPGHLELYLRAFKMGRRLEAWGRQYGSGEFVLLRTYRLAGTSGTLGPKRWAGDGQIPEGFYTINRFNPASEYLLSLGLDYPNTADLRHTTPDPGGDIFIHGSDVTVGCLPITDAGIQDLYVLAVEARAAGQTDIAVHIFPFEMTAENLGRRVASPHSPFWQGLVAGYQYFEDYHQLPCVSVDARGAYAVE
jgi:murein L,D-transpeptidase YafK